MIGKVFYVIFPVYNYEGKMKLLQPNPVHHSLATDWKYVQSGNTDIRKTFKRIREKIALQKTAPTKIRQLKVK